jgi:predicted phosphodiesterase
MLRIISDVHGKFQQYEKLTKTCDESIQVGDMGFDYSYLNKHIDPKKHKFFKGNHDLYTEHQDAKPHHLLKDFGMIDEYPIFIIRGAWSIDWLYRTPGFDWFENEELSENEFDQCLEEYKKAKPNIVLSHTCPQEVKLDILDNCDTLSNGKDYLTRTELRLQDMFDYHRPHLWIFGHWHIKYNKNFNGTKFLCTPELGYVDIDMEKIYVKDTLHKGSTKE